MGWSSHGIPSVTENEQWRCSTCYCDEDLGAQLGCISALHISASAGAATEDSCGQGQEQPGMLQEAAVLNGITIAQLPSSLARWHRLYAATLEQRVLRECVWACDWSAISFSYFPSISLVWVWADRETQQTSNPLTVSCRASNFRCLLGRPPSLSQNLNGARAPCLPTLAQWTANSTPHPQTFAFNYPEFNHRKQILPGHNFKRGKNKCCRSQTVISDPPSRFTMGFFSCPCYVVLVSEPLPGQIYLIRNLVINQILWGFKESCKHKQASRKFSLSLCNDYHCFSVKPHLHISSAVTSHAMQVAQGKWEEETHQRNRPGVREMIPDYINGTV